MLMSTACADRRDALAHLGHQPLVRPAHGGDDAELGGAGRGGLDGGLDQRRDVQPGRAHRRGEQARLRAEVAVLGAAAGLDRDDALDLDLGAAPAHAAPRARARAGRAGASSGSCSTASTCASSSPRPSSSTCVAGGRRGCRQRLRPSAVGLVMAIVAEDSSRSGSVPHRRCRRAPGQPGPGGEQELGGVQRPAPAGSAPASGRAASVSRSRTLLRQARSGSAGQAPITTPASARPRCAMASRVSAVWLSVPSAGSGHDQRRSAPSSRARSARVAPSSSKRTSSPPGALDEHQVAVGGELADAGRRSGEVERRPARQAGRPPPGRAGRGTGPARAGRSTPASRRTSSRSPGSAGRPRSGPASRPRPGSRGPRPGRPPPR